jgi:hypothetical protein
VQMLIKTIWIQAAFLASAGDAEEEWMINI